MTELRNNENIEPAIVAGKRIKRQARLEVRDTITSLLWFCYGLVAQLKLVVFVL